MRFRIATGALVAMATVALSAGTAPAQTPAADSAQVALGDALLAQFDADRGVVPTPETRRVESYLQRIADSLGRHTKRHLPWRIHYDPDPAIKSGFALPGGRIVIWAGVLSYMSTEDEAAAIIAHEMEHTDDGQVNRRIDSLVTTKRRDVHDPSQWRWGEFGASYGETLENLCDYDGAKLAVQAGYSPLGYKMLLQSYVALGAVHDQKAPPPKAIVDRIDQIEHEIATEHWERLTKTRPLRLP